MGGSLSKPHERFPSIFKNQFWQEYPYFLPCVATSSFVFVTIVVTAIFFKEVRPSVISHVTLMMFILSDPRRPCRNVNEQHPSLQKQLSQTLLMKMVLFLFVKFQYTQSSSPSSITSLSLSSTSCSMLSYLYSSLCQLKLVVWVLVHLQLDTFGDVMVQ